jgi:hypothetical protein
LLKTKRFIPFIFWFKFIQSFLSFDWKSILCCYI